MISKKERIDVPEGKDTSTMVITLRLDVGVSHEEHGEDDGDDVPAGEDKARETLFISTQSSEVTGMGTYVKL